MVDPSLSRFGARRNVRAAVLVLHGGQERSEEPVLRRHASWARMWLVAQAIRRKAAGNGVAVWLLRNQVRGWNASAGGEPAPVRDARWAMDQLRATHPGVPVVLLGHSMGGRTANHAADDEDVVGVVALAPWLPRGEPVRTKPLLVLHGTADTWTSPAGSRMHAERVRAAGGDAAWLPVEGAGHSMVTSMRRWHRFARDCSLGLLGVHDLPADVRAALESRGRADRAR
jgi:alpha-beta hydrolase superfamily lysophospholipase